jgi:hypothetical protein
MTPTLTSFLCMGSKDIQKNTWTHSNAHKATRIKAFSLKSLVGMSSKNSREGNAASSALHTSDRSACFWPQEFLVNDFPNTRIFTYGYDSAVTNFFAGPANTGNILDRGQDLLQRISSFRTQCPGRPLIFIAHSLGGLVVKSVSQHSPRRPRSSALLTCASPRFFDHLRVQVRRTKISGIYSRRLLPFCSLVHHTEEVSGPIQAKLWRDSQARLDSQRPASTLTCWLRTMHFWNYCETTSSSVWTQRRISTLPLSRKILGSKVSKGLTNE